jgi:hypothetical protein
MWENCYTRVWKRAQPEIRQTVDVREDTTLPVQALGTSSTERGERSEP